MEQNKISSPPPNSAEGGWFGLLALLLTVVIMVILATYLLRGPGALSPGNAGGGVAGGEVGGIIAAKNKAKGVVCRNNLVQLRDALAMAGTDEEGNRPATLEDLAKNTPGLALKCPVGGEPYQYDPSTGRIWCIHPGHENF
jgi:hypothetical protein